MKISKIAARPQLITISITDPDIVEKYGEPVEFHTWDRQPLDKFMRLATVQTHNASEIIDLAKDLILDEQGEPVIKDGVVLPTVLMTRAIQYVVQALGK